MGSQPADERDDDRGDERDESWRVPILCIVHQLVEPCPACGALIAAGL